MKIQADLYPMDVLISRKWEEKWWPPSTWPTQVFQAGVYCYGKNLYKGQLWNEASREFLKSTHARIYVGEVSGVELGFDFTWPSAHFFEWKDWMEDPEYGAFFRHLEFGGKITAEKVFQTCLPHDGKMYDIGDLLDTALGIRFFNFGDDNYYCSAGARRVVEDITGEELFPEVKIDKTPPCSWAFSPSWKQVALLNEGIAI